MTPASTSRTVTKWIYDHLFFGLVLIAGPLVFLFVPQVFNLWYSQNPPLSFPGTWLLLWLAFALFLVLGLLFFFVSVYLVPTPLTQRREPGSTSEPGRLNKLFRFVKWVIGPAEVVIDWVVTRPAACIDVLPRWLRFVLGVAVLAGAGALLVYGPTGTSSQLYTLSGAFVHNFGWWLVLLGIWICLCWFIVPSKESLRSRLESGEARYPVLILGGRLLAWLTASMLVAELLWISATSPQTAGVVSYRVSTMWLLLHLWGVATVVAGCLDFLDRHAPVVPVRLIAAVAVAVLALVIRPGANSDVRLLVPAANETETERPVDGYDQLEARLRSIPDGEPVVLVAASGGGSRAAVFAALVFEFLARRPMPPAATGDAPTDRFWSDNIVLISSVSGGSLATAHFVNRGCKPSKVLEQTRFSILDELTHRIDLHIDELSSFGPADGSKTATFEAAKQRAAKMKGSLSSGSAQADPDRWIVTSQFVDDMCMNFMAPILRGANSAGLYRGDALARFWEDSFQWRDSSNLTGFDASLTASTDRSLASPNLPLVLFNACDVGKGSRIAIGFPPLPPDAFQSMADATRPSPAELAHLYQPAVTEVPLSKAVRLSSNFPWGFHASTVAGQRDVGGTQRTVPTLVLDGGVSDNTGIDTVYELIRGLPNTHRGQSILRLLQARQVVLLEIDSGAKPTPPTMVDRLLGAALEPVQALSNASYTNADQAKEHHLAHLAELLAPPLQCDDPQLTPEQLTVHRQRPQNVYQITVRCNHFSLQRPDRRAVMTAWALGSDDKANVMARFAFELAQLETSLQDVEDARADFATAKQLADALLPEAAAQRVGQEAEDSREFAASLDPILDTLDPKQLSTEQRSGLEQALVPFANAAQQVADTAEAADAPSKSPNLSKPELQKWAADYQQKLQSKVPVKATRAATTQVRVAPSIAPTGDSRQQALDALHQATQNLKSKHDKVQRATNESNSGSVPRSKHRTSATRPRFRARLPAQDGRGGQSSQRSGRGCLAASSAVITMRWDSPCRLGTEQKQPRRWMAYWGLADSSPATP